MAQKTVVAGSAIKSKAVANSAVNSTVKSVKTATPTLNLTAKQLKTWKTSVDTAITKNLVTSLKKAYEDAVQLHKVTGSGQDSNDLSYRFNDLAKVTNQAAQQLTLFMKSFDSSLDTYIGTVEKAEKTAAEKVKKSIDQFAEAASKISKLKM